MNETGAAAWIPRLQRWAESDSNVRLALVVGSQARTEMPADRFSDIDLLIFARDAERLLTDERWIAALGPYWTSHLEQNALESGPERRVLFEDGQDVDFSVFPEEILAALTTDERGAVVLRRGFRTLVNKESVDLTVAAGSPAIALPTLSEFTNLVNDYWFHLVWTAKKLRRGERLAALEATNGYLRALLVRAVRWHAIAGGPNRAPVWHGARFFESWADPRVVRELPATVAEYEDRSIAGALRGGRTLFSWLTEELRERLSFPPPIRDRSGVSSYLDELLGDLGR